MKLLTRDLFRESTLARNGGLCLEPSCPLPAVDAHHILNRRLFKEDFEYGGYFFENGAGLCSTHHLEAERTIISNSSLYSWANIAVPAIPAHLDPSLEYDTWGNIVVSDYERLAGELFTDEGCQKALKAGQKLWMVYS